MQQNSSTVNSKTVFRHMDLNAALSNENVSAEVEGSYSKDGMYGLKYGIFQYYLKSGNSIYWYETEAEETPDVMTPGLVNAESGFRTTPNKALIENKKYAYKIVPVDVNPIISNITKGKGTKAEPFQIENEGQLITLALCLKTNGDNTKAGEWYVGNASDYPGYDEEDSTTWESNESNNIMKRSDAVEYMRTAYYELAENIDFNQVYKQIVPNDSMVDSVNNFCGIGTANTPFAGNIDGKNHTITLSNYGGNQTYVYGLFQYVSGVYVKDLTIKLEGKTDTDNYIYIHDTDNSTKASVGMVAANCLGADNVIDNVTVDAEVRIQSTNQNPHFTANIGGYFGTTEYGSVTLVNMNENSLKNYRVKYMYYAVENGENVEKTGLVRSYINSTGDSVNKNINGITGSSVGTYYVYSDDTAANNPSQLDSTTQYIEVIDRESYNYGIVNDPVKVADIHYENDYGLRALFDTDVINENFIQTAGKMKVSRNEETGGLYVDVDNEKQLYILGIALKSGSLSASTENTSSANAYYKLAKTWKTEKSWIGESLSDAENDYSSWYPAIFQYFDVSALAGGYRDLMVDGYSILNDVSSNCYNFNTRTTYRLKENTLYDMSKIERFTGIGDNTYSGGSLSFANSYAVFNGNFDGRGSEVKLNIDNSTETTLGLAGLFPQMGSAYNNSYSKAENAFEISNLTISGNVNSSMSSGGLCGFKSSGIFKINNVNAKDLTVTASGSGYQTQANGIAAGLIAVIQTNTGYFTYLNYNEGDKSTFENVTVDGYNIAGTVMGYARCVNANNIDVNNCSVHSTIGNAGGLFGNKHNGAATYLDNISVTNSNISSDGKNVGVGGIVGGMYRNDALCALHDILVDNNTLSATASTYVGKLYGTTNDKSNEIGILNFNDLYTDEIPAVGNYLGSAKKNVAIYYNDFHELAYAEQLYEIERYAESEGETDLRYADLLDRDVFALDTGEIDSEGNAIKQPIDLIPDNDNADDYDLIKWSSDAGTMEQVLNSILNTLTNGTGELNAQFNDNISVTVIPMEVNDGVVSVSTNQAAVNVEKTDNSFIVTNNNIYDSYEKTINGVHTPGTYSLIKVTYGVGSNHFTETVTIPFFVSNMVNVDIYSRTIIGEEYSPEIMRNITDTSVKTAAKDSSYTIYTEYMYSSNRSDFVEAIYMNKIFRMDNKAKPVIPVGAKLTLVDITDDKPHTYYYKVTGQIVEIPLTDFVDENGIHYKERDISKFSELANNNVVTTMYTNGRHFTKYNRGVERYFIFMDCSEVTSDSGITSLQSTIIPSIVDYSEINSKEIFYIKEKCRTTLSTYNPRFIGFTDHKAEISDTIVNKSTNLRVSAEIYNTASNEYWANAKDNDYSNNNKYLEVAVSFENEEGDKIILPSGTRVKLADNQLEQVKNTSNIYYFKDGADLNGYSLDSIDENTTKPISFMLDFNYARMENLPAGNYRMCIELVRTSNKAFPMGDDIIDTVYTEYFAVGGSAEYGFKIDYSNDIYNKAIESETHSISFKMMCNSTLQEEEIATKDVVIKYRLLKKDKVSGNYSTYVMDEINSEYPVEIKKEIPVNQNGDYKEIAVDDLPAANEAAIEIPFAINLTDAFEATNYKLEAALYVNGNEEARDYMIFNISDIR